ncbi:MAG TPA: AI-2E family transporter [Vicinamibacterales bacterium]|nr:AI-2E family transporter [Vicinamibacterales bacterium]
MTNATPRRDQASGAAAGHRQRSVVIALVAVLAGLFLWAAGQLLLLVFAGVLLAVFLRTLASWLSGMTPLPVRWALLVVVLGLVGVSVLVGVLFAPRLAEQASELTDRLPRAISQFTEQLKQYSWSRWLIEQAPEPSEVTDPAAVAGSARQAASGLMDALVGAVVVLFVGLYLAAEPRPYLRGLLRLVPVARRRRAASALFAAGHTLRWWLLGQVLSMIVVGIITGVGLALIGVPLALVLGVLAGLFEFIPTLGPFIAFLPALLLGLLEGPQAALAVVALYGFIQTVEGYLLTPLVQRKTVHLPPVVTIATQVFLAWTMGPVGLLVAVPLVAVVMVTTQMLYVEDVLGDRLELEAEQAGAREMEESRLLDGLQMAEG